MHSKIPTAFFAYSSRKPTLAEAIHEAARQLCQSKRVKVKTWEECRVGGKIIMQEICKEIDASDIFLADLTGINANVMFELGYAIARDKRVWLVLDVSYAGQKKLFDQLRVLTTIGYAACSNSTEIVKAFFRDDPTSDTGDTIFQSAIKPNLATGGPGCLLYLKSRHDNEASIRISKRIQSSECPTVTDDPRESTVQSITWYGTQVFASRGVLCHLTDPEREGARLQSARYALVAGMAFGFAKNLLMLAEGDFLAPMDYRELLKHYATANEASKHLEEWLDTVHRAWAADQIKAESQLSSLAGAAELRQLRLGEHVAENEWRDLVDDYFVPTAAYENALKGGGAVFVGRRGAGKTANLYKLQHTLGADRRNVVCVIKPVGYEMQGLVSLVNHYQRRDSKGYAIQSLWKFLLYSEIARAVAQWIMKLPPGAADNTQMQFVDFVEQHKPEICEDFSIRLEACAGALLKISSRASEEGIGSERVAISEALHMGILRELRSRLGQVLAKKERVAILVDNLDKAWEIRSDVEVLCEILLGLLDAAQQLPIDFARSDIWRRPVSVSIAVFLRSDIFHEVKKAAAEPDKIGFARLQWKDAELLRRVVEERFTASHQGDASPQQLWERYFCDRVQNIPTKQYIPDVILQRPRDIIYFANAAIACAVNRKHLAVTEADVQEAENQYSLHALESLIAENTLVGVNLEDVLFGFSGRSSILPYAKVEDILRDADVSDDRIQEVLDLLCSLTFLGMEVDRDTFAFSDDPQEFRRDAVRARHFRDREGTERRYKIHRAFWKFLDIRAEAINAAQERTRSTGSASAG